MLVPGRVIEANLSAIFVVENLTPNWKDLTGIWKLALARHRVQKIHRQNLTNGTCI